MIITRLEAIGNRVPVPVRHGPVARMAGSIVLAALGAALLLGPPVIAGEDKPEEAKAPHNGVRIQVAPGSSIQQAIDAAPGGAIIVLAPGTHRGSPLRIGKALTLEGAGWEQTTLHPSEQAGAEPVPSITIIGAKGVAIRGLRVSRASKAQQNATAVAARGSVSSDPIIAIEASEVTITGAAIVGPSGNGVSISDASKVRMSKSLVAAIWGTGVRVEGGPDSASASELHMRECVVRNCYHRCITLGANTNNSLIERSWISGSAWHGIRYDHASPRIERNVIFANARSGIYASGKTAAIVTRNAFIANEMGGISCWFQNADRITNNIFAQNKREGLAVLGASTPQVSGNWFAGEQIAITCGKIGGEGPTAQTSGKPHLVDNCFTDTKVALQVDRENAPLPAGNLVLDDLSEKSFQPWKHGPLDSKKDAVGYVLPGGIRNLTRSPLFPELLPEEEIIIPTGPTRDSRSWNTSGKPRSEAEKTGPSKHERDQMLAAAREAVKPWIDDAFQLDDVAKREAVIGKVRSALASKDQDEVRKGLVAFTSLGQIRFDKASFHDLFLPLLKHEDPTLRILAGQSLVMSGVQDGDVERLVAMTGDRDRDVRQSAGGHLVWALEKDLTGPAGAAILKLLNEDDVELRKNIIRTLWGIRFSPAIEARIIELSRDPHDGTDVLYFALSTQANKSEASVKRIIEFLAHKDTHNVGGRAAWGLGQGVAREQQGLVADAALRVVAARSEGYLFRESMKRLHQYATPAQVDGINALLAKPGVDGEFRKALEAILGKITSK